METDIHAAFCPGFQAYIGKKFNSEGTDSFETIIRSVTASDKEAFYKFFELLDEFMDQMTVR